MKVAVASLFLAAALYGCGATTSFAPAPRLSNASIATSALRDAERSWSRSVFEVPLPAAGCFQATYPAVAWSRVACVAPPRQPFASRSKRMNPAVIGNGNDYAIDVLPLTMTGAIGEFPSVSGVTSVTSCAPHDANDNSCNGHGYGANVYSLQLNSNNFATAACGKQKHCLGWEQFVYTNQPKYYGGGGNLIIQDWLLSSTAKGIPCPHNAGWIPSGGSCYKNAPYSVRVPNVRIDELDEVRLAGSATSNGDSVFFSVAGYVYGMKNAQDDGVTDLADHWTGAEFNIVGNGGGTQAVFNAGAAITVAVQAVTVYSTAPACEGNAGTTGEENSLSFVAPPLNPRKRQYPSIVFTESNVSTTGPPGCIALDGM